MLLGIISDIHVDINRRDGEEVVSGYIAEEILRKGIDTLLIAGDISSDYLLTLETVRKLREATGRTILFVPGNHDIWNEHHPETRAWDTYNAMLEDPGNIAARPFRTPEGWTILGDLGWYDFSFGDPSFSFEEFTEMQREGRVWQDKIMSIWDRDTTAMHRLFLERLSRSLDVSDPAKTVAVTHVVSVRDFIVQNPGPMWRYFNAFLGSPEYGSLFVSRGGALAVAGHVHYRRSVRHGNTEFICPCLGYTSEWKDPTAYAKEIAETLVTRTLGT